MLKTILLGLFLVPLWACAPQGPQSHDRPQVKLGMQLEPPGLDPTRGAAGAIDDVVYANVFEGLTRITQDGSVKPALAKSWTVSPDGREYLFTLQAGVRFHDGSAFDAGDVKYTLDRARAADSVNAQKALFTPIENVEALDPLHVKITLSHPVGDFLFNMGLGDAVMVDPKSAANNAVHPIGTGPFLFSKWRKGYAITLSRNDDYWGTAAKSPSIQFVFITDPAAAFAALMGGDVHGFGGFPAPENLPAFEANPRFDVVIGATEGEAILAINNGRAPFNDARVRRALAHALNHQEIIDGALFGRGIPIGSHFSPGHRAYVDMTGLYPYDPARARVLLAEAGYPKGFAVTLKLPPPSYARRSGEIIAAQLAKVGIQVSIENIEWAAWLEQVFTNKDYDLSIVAHTEPMDIGIYGRDDYYFQYHSEAFQALMSRLSQTSDPAARDRLYGEAQRLIAKDSVNGFLFQLVKMGVWDKRLKGMWANAPIQGADLHDVYLEN
jgi:peptide/nickel transport system substrate-binding protein